MPVAYAHPAQRARPQVAKVTPIERHKQGVVCVKFKSSAEARAERALAAPGIPRI